MDDSADDESGDKATDTNISRILCLNHLEDKDSEITDKEEKAECKIRSHTIPSSRIRRMTAVMIPKLNADITDISNCSLYTQKIRQPSSVSHRRITIMVNISPQ